MVKRQCIEQQTVTRVWQSEKFSRKLSCSECTVYVTVCTQDQEKSGISYLLGKSRNSPEITVWNLNTKD